MTITDATAPTGGRLSVGFFILMFGVSAGLWYYLNFSVVGLVWILIGLAVVTVSWVFGIKKSIITGLATLGVGFDVILWLWPIMMIFATWSVGLWLVPDLYQVVQFPMQDSVKDAVLIMGSIGALLAVVSAVSSFVMVREERIIINLLTSVLWTVVIHRMDQAYGSQYWTMIPLVVSTAEVIAGIIGSVHNAWNKNPTQVQSGGGGRVTIN